MELSKKLFLERHIVNIKKKKRQPQFTDKTSVYVVHACDPMLSIAAALKCAHFFVETLWHWAFIYPLFCLNLTNLKCIICTVYKSSGNETFQNITWNPFFFIVDLVACSCNFCHWCLNLTCTNLYQPVINTWRLWSWWQIKGLIWSIFCFSSEEFHYKSKDRWGNASHAGLQMYPTCVADVVWLIHCGCWLADRLKAFFLLTKMNNTNNEVDFAEDFSALPGGTVDTDEFRQSWLPCLGTQSKPVGSVHHWEFSEGSCLVTAIVNPPYCGVKNKQVACLTACVFEETKRLLSFCCGQQYEWTLTKTMSMKRSDHMASVAC